MTADPRRVKELFVAVLDLPDAQARQAFLERECGDDADLRQRLDVLLKAHDDPFSALERPLPVDGPATADYHGPAEEVGAIIAGKYKLVENLGQGGMGDVFMAQQTTPVKRLVALKLIKRGMDSRQVLARFEAERQALALMDHPNIAKVLDAGATESGRPFFVMELVKGVPITRFCDERQLSPRERLELFIPVCQAIQHAHQKGVIHRDIKPSNVLVALYDDRPVPKVIDFGVAKAAGTQLTDASLVTVFGTIVGTPEYMSPEQAQLNQLDIDTRSDVYALGVLLYELLTGTTPIDRKRLGQDALLEILRVIREEEPPRPSNRLSTSNALASIAATRRTEPAKLTKLLRGELDWIVMKCLEKERSRRYETANALARDLERYLHDEVVEARQPSAGYRLRKLMRKHRTALAMAATVVLLLLAGVALSTWQAVRARRAERETVEALLVSEQNREEADQQRQQADEQRKRAERQAASVAMDMDLKYCEDGEIALGLLRLAETLRTMPAHAEELRECAALNILAWGQLFLPAWTLDHDGFAVDEALLSPDGRTVLSIGREGSARLWDSLTGKQRSLLSQSPPKRVERERHDSSGMVQFSKDGSIALTLHGRRSAFVHENLLGFHVIEDSDGIVRLWDVATGQQRAATAKNAGSVFGVRLSQNNSLLATVCSPHCAGDSGPFVGEDRPSRCSVFLWNAWTGQLIRKLDFQGSTPSIDVSPDGKSVLIARDKQFGVWSPEAEQPRKRLPGDRALFSPQAGSALSTADNVIYWWNTADWQLHRTIDLSSLLKKGLKVIDLRFLSEDVIDVELLITNSFGDRTNKIFVKNLPKPIPEEWDTSNIEVSPNGRLVFMGNRVYDAQDGQRLSLPRERKFHPELSQLSQDGRFTSIPGSTIVDLATDKQIGARAGYEEIKLLKDRETWILFNHVHPRIVLRKADAALDAELLCKWCRVVVRGQLDENGRFSKFDEPMWDKARMKFVHILNANPKAQSLRAAATDPLYWLRQEIKELEFKEPAAALVLLDRLVAAEPTWPHYSQRAAVHAKREHWDSVIQDELEAARLTGELYWITAESESNRMAGVRVVQAPGLPHEQYQRALRWVEARIRAGVETFRSDLPSQNIVAGMALFRLDRYADALSRLQKHDLPKFSEAAGMLMSRWSLLTLMHPSIGRSPREDSGFSAYYFDPFDLLVRAMCHHHLGHPREAKACLNYARGIWPKDSKSIDAAQRALLREAESLIVGTPCP